MSLKLGRLIRQYNLGKHIALVMHGMGAKWRILNAPKWECNSYAYQLVHMKHRKVLEAVIEGVEVRESGVYGKYFSRVNAFMAHYDEAMDYEIVPAKVAQDLEGTYARASQEVFDLYRLNGYGSESAEFYEMATYIGVKTNKLIQVYGFPHDALNGNTEIHIENGRFKYGGNYDDGGETQLPDPELIPAEPFLAVESSKPEPFTAIEVSTGHTNDLNFTSELILDSGKVLTLEGTHFEAGVSYVVHIHKINK